ncbi:TonB-dependent receptor [Carboxylicivirga mesophila]|uniref:TonB-dependent receptor n=1 Tax=Carboxylicivirga mesophila TaxID=1166478 RepID=A0ABS5KCR3_9BACT|nr:TonB-dependent receptor [Carboxylicivirga mesophila]MBS2212617.1 TonB-dependent receptor [Carboxylicivirga mesophila]
MNSKGLILLLVLIKSTVLFAQNGQVIGKITDKKTGEELIGAAIIVEGTTMGTTTNFDGEFSMPPLDEGTYTLRVQYISYQTEIVSDVVVKEGAPTVLSIALSPADMDLGEVMVVAKANREHENMLLLEQKKAIVAVQSIGAQELSRKGIGDAESAVSKVSGVSKQEGVKNVFVRGLGDRTLATTLNGFPVPSEDPRYKNIALDMFQSDVIQSVGVDKAFTADRTGDVGSAIIDVRTKVLQSDEVLSLSVSGGVNAQAAQGTFLKTDGVNALGFANIYQGPAGGKFPDSYAFQNKLDPSAAGYVGNQSYTLSAGKQLKVNDNPLSVFVTGGYSSDVSKQDGHQRNMTNNGTIYKDMGIDKYDINTSHLLMANANYQWRKDNSLSYNFMAIHTSNQYFSELEGYDNDALQSGAERDSLLLHRQQINDNVLLVNQLYGNFRLSDKLMLDAGVAVNTVNSHEPDRRINFLYINDGKYSTYTRKGMNQRFFSDLSSQDINSRLAFTYDMGDEDRMSAISAGYTNRLTSDRFNGIQYEQRLQNTETIVFDRKEDVSFDYIYNQERFDAGQMHLERIHSYYEVNKYVHAVYANGVFQLSPSLFVTGGIGLDYVDILVDFVGELGEDGSLNGRRTNRLDQLFILPSANLKYDLNEQHTLRMGVSRTYTMPQSRELSPFEYIGMTFKERGNEELRPATNNNLDIKWDNYLSRSELLSVGAFYKLIEDPISRYSSNNAGGFLLYDNVGDVATVAGVEMELRKNLFEWGNDDRETLSRLSLGLNATYTYSQVKLHVNPASQPTEPNSQLEGAAPVIINSDISYTYRQHKRSVTGSVLFNYFSDRMYSIGYDGMPSLYEQGVPTLDVVVSGQLSSRLGVSLKCQNLLNPAFVYYRDLPSGERLELEQFRKGSAVSFGLNYTF